MKTEIIDTLLLSVPSVTKCEGGYEKKMRTGIKLLEYFGEVYSPTSGNSSRFGRFYMAHVNHRGELFKVTLSGFMLEKSRIVQRQSGEGSFMIFYHMLSGMSKEDKEYFNLLSLSDYSYLNGSSPEKSGDKMDDIFDSLSSIGISMSQVESIFKTLSAILLMGNINFEEFGDSVRVSNYEGFFLILIFFYFKNKNKKIKKIIK